MSLLLGLCGVVISGGFAEEAIAGASNGQKVSWGRGIIFDHASESHDEIVDGPAGHFGGILPDLGLQPGSRKNDAIIFEEVAQEFLFPGCERMDFVAVLQLKATEVHEDITEANDVFGGANGSAIQVASAFVQQIANSAE